MKTTARPQLIRFLQEELAIPGAAIRLALKQCQEQLHILPIALWQYGLVTTEQLDRIFDWMETA